MLRHRILRAILTPTYFFQPLQLFKRVGRKYLWRSRSNATVTLPWGLAIRVNPHEALGHEIVNHGLYEVAVTEVLWRLTEPGDFAVDGGANIGYTTGNLAVRVGPHDIAAG